MPHGPYGYRPDWSDRRRQAERSEYRANERWPGENRYFGRPDRYMSREEAEEFSRNIGEGEWGWQAKGHERSRDHRGLMDRAQELLRGGRREDERRDFRGRGPRGYARSDARIGEDVCDRLTEDPHLDASDIEVQVYDREVTLNGLVSSREDKHRAERLAERCPGVEQVQSNLRVR